MSIDSIGERFAICEDDYFRTVYIDISDLPDGASEGDIIQVNDDGSLEINKQPRFWFYKSNILKTKEKQTLT